MSNFLLRALFGTKVEAGQIWKLDMAPSLTIEVLEVKNRQVRYCFLPKGGAPGESEMRIFWFRGIYRLKTTEA